MQTLLDAPNCRERRFAIIACELVHYDIDIAALSETRISGSSSFTEVGAGYTFVCEGQPNGQPQQHGVGFAIKTSIIQYLEEPSCGMSQCIMTMKLKLNHGCSIVFISAYSPTLTAEDEDKEAFYKKLNSIIQSTPYRHHLFLLGDFNARVGQDTSTWPKVLGHHSYGNENSNGTLLLQTCAQHELSITKLPIPTGR